MDPRHKRVVCRIRAVSYTHLDVYKRQGNYQMLTHFTINPTEEFIGQTSTAFYDVLVEVEKA